MGCLPILQLLILYGVVVWCEAVLGQTASFVVLGQTVVSGRHLLTVAGLTITTDFCRHDIPATLNNPKSMDSQPFPHHLPKVLALMYLPFIIILIQEMFI